MTVLHPIRTIPATACLKRPPYLLVRAPGMGAADRPGLALVPDDESGRAAIAAFSRIRAIHRWYWVIYSVVIACALTVLTSGFAAMIGAAFPHETGRLLGVLIGALLVLALIGYATVELFDSRMPNPLRSDPRVAARSFTDSGVSYGQATRLLSQSPGWTSARSSVVSISETSGTPSSTCPARSVPVEAHR